MTLRDAALGKEYKIISIGIEDEEWKGFLFSLGCYEGEPITVITHLKSGSTVSIKDGRYHIDYQLAKAIEIQE